MPRTVTSSDASPLLRNLAPLVLASGSPRRRELLSALGLDFCVRTSPAEPDPLPAEDPEAFALRAARAKALDVAGGNDPRVAGAFVLAADTVVAVDDVILGKPVDAADARRMLEMLAGREHLVVTGCCLVSPQGQARGFAARARVRMAAWGAEAWAAYAATGEPLDKAGAYGVQGIGAFLVSGLDGSHGAVIGLPAAETVAALLEAGAVAFASAPVL